jgi:hypothetical protein
LNADTTSQTLTLVLLKILLGIPTKLLVLLKAFDVSFRKTVSVLLLIYTGEHRWIAIANMIQFHNAVGSTELTNVFVGTAQQVGK